MINFTNPSVSPCILALPFAVKGNTLTLTLIFSCLHCSSLLPALPISGEVKITDGITGSLITGLLSFRLFPGLSAPVSGQLPVYPGPRLRVRQAVSCHLHPQWRDPFMLVSRFSSVFILYQTLCLQVPGLLSISRRTAYCNNQVLCVSHVSAPSFS